MLILLVLAFLSSIAYAANQPSLEVSSFNYGELPLGGDQSHSVALNRFQWRLGHQWQGSDDALAAALSYKRIDLLQKKEKDRDSIPLDHTFYQLLFEFTWTRRWNQSWATAAMLMPVATAEKFADENRYPVRGGFLVLREELGLGVGRLEVSGRLRWWPLVSVRQQWRGIRVEGLFPRYLDVQKGMLKLRASLEGATYLIEKDWDTFQPLYFSHLDLGTALLVSEGPLAVAFEIGRTIRQRFEGPVPRAKDQTIDDGWYIRTSLIYPSTKKVRIHPTPKVSSIPKGFIYRRQSHACF